MRQTRRQILAWGAAIAASAAITGCGKSLEQRFTKSELPKNAFASPKSVSVTSLIVTLLNRAGYGPRPGDITHVSEMGFAAYVTQQLAPNAIAEPDILNWRLRSLGDVLNADSGLLFDMDDRHIVQTLRQATILRAVYSQRQLFERMVEFWSDHFNIYALKGEGAQLKVLDDRETIRKHALGKFRDLLGASARSAAMLGYLDNGVNRKGVPNENYARELMELHTLGVHGGYTQHDVQEVARCLTGWTSEKHWHRSRFAYIDDWHDNGPKQVLGTILPADGGIKDGEHVLDLLANQTATATHLAKKLCLYFLGTAPKDTVDQVASVYLKSRGDITSMLGVLLTETNFAEAKPIFKRPFDYTVSALRALNADTDGGIALQGHLDAMGQPLFAWPMPDGFPQQTRAWSGALLPRWNFALALTNGTIDNTSVDLSDLSQAASHSRLSLGDALLESHYGCAATTPSLAPLRTQMSQLSDPQDLASVSLMSPEFQWR